MVPCCLLTSLVALYTVLIPEAYDAFRSDRGDGLQGRAGRGGQPGGKEALTPPSEGSNREERNPGTKKDGTTERSNKLLAGCIDPDKPG